MKDHSAQLKRILLTLLDKLEKEELSLAEVSKQAKLIKKVISEMDNNNDSRARELIDQSTNKK